MIEYVFGPYYLHDARCSIIRPANVRAKPIVPSAAVLSNVPDLLRVNGVIWKEHTEQDEIVLGDQSSIFNQERISTLRWQHHFLHWNPEQPLPEVNFIDYFKLMFPVAILETLLQSTSADIAHHHGSLGAHLKAPLKEDEFFRYLGMRLVMSLVHLSNNDEYWKVARAPNDLTEPMRFGEVYGISKHRFEIIEQHLRWSQPDQVRLTIALSFLTCVLSFCCFGFLCL